jgi:OOP family OmpA-OmpF porin
MKKIALSALVAATLVSASDFNYEITPVAGYMWNSTQNETTGYMTGDTGAMGGVQNHAVYGLEFQANELDFMGIKPELSVLYGRDTINQQNSPMLNPMGTTGQATGVLDAMVNGVYEVDTGTFVTPFVKAGFGYEWYTNTHPSDFDGVIVDAGLGLKADLTKHIALKLEGLYMYKMNNNGSATDATGANYNNGSNGEVHNVAALAGLTFSFDEKAAPVVAAVAAPVAAVVAEEPKPAPEPTPVVAAPVPVEKCANAPKGFVLDDNCEPLKKSFNINFPFNSSKIIDTEAPKVAEFATFLKDSPAYKTELVGYTDSVGTEQYNQKLSEKRAAAVKAELEKDGIAADRLTTSGKGEADPVATNKTKEGRWLNRRVDAILAQ